MSTTFLANRLQQLGLSGVADELNQMTKKQNEEIPEIPTFFEPSIQAIEDVKTSFLYGTGLETFQSKYPSRIELIEMRTAADQLTTTFRFQSLGGGKTLSYPKYVQMKDKFPDNVQKFLTANLFVKINGGNGSTVKFDDFFNYMNTVVYSVPHIKVLLSYDASNSGVISEENFRKYVCLMSSTYCFVKEFSKGDHEFNKMYVDYVVSMIFARLDPLYTGFIEINQLLTDPTFAKFMTIDPDEDPEDDIVNKNNIFGPYSSKAMIDVFTKICSSGNGLLTVDDIMMIPGLRWCRAFSEAMIAKANPRPDFSWYVRAQTSYDYVGDPWANAFFFDVMDFNCDGVITEEDLQVIYEEVSQEYLRYETENPLPPLQWIASEMFDLYGISDATITKDLFINTKATSGFIRHFVDIRGFIKWEGNKDILNPSR